MYLGILGAGGLGREVLEAARAANAAEKRYDGFVFIDVRTDIGQVCGVRVCTLEEAVKDFGSELEVILGVGQPALRKKIIKETDELRLPWARIIHPKATVSDTASVGEGTFIGPHAFISCNGQIGRNCLIHAGVVVGHDCVIGENTSICACTAIGGACRIGRDVFIGMGSSVIQECTLGDGTTVSMGSAVMKPLPDNVVAMGNPARVIKYNDEQKVF